MELNQKRTDVKTSSRRGMGTLVWKYQTKSQATGAECHRHVSSAYRESTVTH